VFVELLPNDTFYEYMRFIGKEGAMNKFPRVLKNGALKNWEEYLAQKAI